MVIPNIGKDKSFVDDLNIERDFLEEAFISMKIMSNEQLVVSYRDALKSDKEKEWIRILKDEIKRRGLKPFKNR
jgi:hypothetical protein